MCVICIYKCVPYMLFISPLGFIQNDKGQLPLILLDSRLIFIKQNPHCCGKCN